MASAMVEEQRPVDGVAASSSSASSSSSSSSPSSSPTSSSSPPPLPSLSLRMGCVTKDNFGQLQRLNAVLFPVQYSDKFYRDSYAEEVRPITHLAFHHDVLIGAVCCKFDQPTLTAEKILKREDSHRRVYIMTLGVLAPYRRYGVGSRLLRLILEYAGQQLDVVEVYLHVQTSNEEALKFYEHFGFAITGTIPNYYKRIEPPDCYIVSKRIAH